MAIRMSTGLKNALLITNPVKDVFAKGFIELFSGTQPSSGDGSEAAYTRRMIIGIRHTVANSTLAYVGTTSFTLAGDVASLFGVGDTIVALLGTTVVSSTVATSVHNTGTTTVTIDDAVLTSGLTEVIRGVSLAATAESGEIEKHADEVWQGKGLSSGTVGWFRFYTNDRLTGTDSAGDKPRLDGNIGSSGDLQAISTTVQENATSTLDSFAIRFPST